MNTDGVSTSTAREDETFAAALGLTSTQAKDSRRRRRDTSGRPLVTAANASEAARNVGTGTAAAPATTTTARVGNGTSTTGSVPVLTPSATTTGSTPTVPTGIGVATAPEKPISWWKRRRMRVRRVRRTIRHIDPWSVFKISVILFSCMYVAVMAAGVLLWRAAEESGIVDRFESFLIEVGVFETFDIQGETLFRSASVIGVVGVAAASAMAVITAILFNLISDLTGGVRVTVLEEDLGRPARRDR